MGIATAKVQSATVPWGDDKIIRGLSSTADTYYPGAMLCLNSSGYLVNAADTSGLVFDGINTSAQTIVVPSGGSNGDYTISCERPWRFQMAINSTVTPANIGSAVYVVDNQTVGLTSSNSILVGWIQNLEPQGALTATSVVIVPLFAPLSNIPVSGNTIAFTGTTGANTITFPDNLANGLSIEQGSNVYFQATSTDGSEVSKLLSPAATGTTNAGGAVQVTAGSGGTTSGTGGTVTILAGAGGAGASVGTGGAVSATGGASTGSGAGGLAKIVGGAGGLTGVGGAAQVTGGAGGSTSGTGGAVTIAAGAGVGTSAVGGAVTIASGASAGASGTAGNVSIDPGSAAGGTAGVLILADANASATYLNRGPLKALQIGLTLTALGTTQSSTPTSAQLLGGFLTQTSVTGAGTITLPTGTALSTACARTPAVGDSFNVVIANLGGGQTLTVTGATGTTVVSGGAIATAKTAIATFINTGSNAWSIAVAGG